MQKDDDYLAALIEDMDDRFDLILDFLSTLKGLPADLDEIASSVARIERAIGVDNLS